MPKTWGEFKVRSEIRFRHCRHSNGKAKEFARFSSVTMVFLTKVYGLSGAQSVHPCLYCTASKPHIQTPPAYNDGSITQGSLSQMKKDYRKFSRAGKGKTKAKFYNNVIRKSLIQIDLDHVAPPYLHILLNIVKKHHNLLEKDCHALDEHIPKSLAKTGGDIEGTSDSLQHYVQQLKSQEGKKQQLQKLRSHIASMSDSLQKEAVRQKIE